MVHGPADLLRAAELAAVSSGGATASPPDLPTTDDPAVRFSAGLAALTRFAKIRQAPGTPAATAGTTSSCVDVHALAVARIRIPPGNGFSPGSLCDHRRVMRVPLRREIQARAPAPAVEVGGRFFGKFSRRVGPKSGVEGGASQGEKFFFLFLFPGGTGGFLSSRGGKPPSTPEK